MADRKNSSNFDFDYYMTVLSCPLVPRGLDGHKNSIDYSLIHFVDVWTLIGACNL